MLEDLLECEILLVPQTSSEQISDLVKREEIAYLAKTRFIAAEISFQDYLDCLEVAGINIDEYLTTINTNYQIVGF